MSRCTDVPINVADKCMYIFVCVFVQGHGNIPEEISLRQSDHLRTVTFTDLGEENKMEIYRLQPLDSVFCLITAQSPTCFVRWWHIPSFWPVLCLFPRRSLFPRSLLASVRRLLAEIHAAQKGRAFQLSATNP